MDTTTQVAQAFSLMRMRPSDTLSAARLLISDGRLWTQGARARDSKGRKCPPNDPSATQWSMTGAIAVVSNPYGITPVWMLQQLDWLAMYLGLVECLYHTDSIILWHSCDDMNDERPHADVMQFLDVAIAWFRDNNQ